MMKEKITIIVAVTAGFAIMALLLLLLPGDLFSIKKGPRVTGGAMAGGHEGRGGFPEEDDRPAGGENPNSAMFLGLLQGMLGDDARKDEALLGFKDEAALKAFLARAAASGVEVLDTMGNVARVKVNSLNALRDDMKKNAGDYSSAGANYYVHIPQVPEKEERAAQQMVGFGDTALAFMGIRGDNSQWGKGVTIAIIDSGIFPHKAFGDRVSYIDLGNGKVAVVAADGAVSSADTHATEVASLAAGTGPGTTGVAPSAHLLSIRVTDVSGTSDIFTLSKAIRTAVDSGAGVINISLGAYSDSPVLLQAVDYATSKNIAVVASAGNDQASQLTYPAAYTNVVSSGAVDANGNQATFSNSGENLSITAPGVGIMAATYGDSVTEFSGTSASAPMVTGAIAALMSQYPGLTSVQAAAQLATYASDAGARGHDSAYGNGVVDMAYATNAGNRNYLDPSLASQYYDAENGVMEYIVQNKSGQSVDGMTLDVDHYGVARSVPVPLLTAGEVWSYQIPVDTSALATQDLRFRSRLVLPQGVTDQNATNNARGSVLFKQ